MRPLPHPPPLRLDAQQPARRADRRLHRDGGRHRPLPRRLVPALRGAGGLPPRPAPGRRPHRGARRLRPRPLLGRLEPVPLRPPSAGDRPLRPLGGAQGPPSAPHSRADYGYRQRPGLRGAGGGDRRLGGGLPRPAGTRDRDRDDPPPAGPPGAALTAPGPPRGRAALSRPPGPLAGAPRPGAGPRRAAAPDRRGAGGAPRRARGGLVRARSHPLPAAPPPGGVVSRPPGPLRTGAGGRPAAPPAGRGGEPPLRRHRAPFPARDPARGRLDALPVLASRPPSGCSFGPSTSRAN